MSQHVVNGFFKGLETVPGDSDHEVPYPCGLFAERGKMPLEALRGHRDTSERFRTSGLVLCRSISTRAPASR